MHFAACNSSGVLLLVLFLRDLRKKRNFQNCNLGVAYLTLKGQRLGAEISLLLNVRGYEGQSPSKKI